jgi:hypothetical protein
VDEFVLSIAVFASLRSTHPRVERKTTRNLLLSFAAPQLNWSCC